MYLFVGSPSSESKSYHQVEVFPGRTLDQQRHCFDDLCSLCQGPIPCSYLQRSLPQGPGFFRNTAILIWSCHGLLLRIPGKVLIFSGAMGSSPFCVVTFSFTEHLGCTVEVIAHLLLWGILSSHSRDPCLPDFTRTCHGFTRTCRVDMYHAWRVTSLHNSPSPWAVIHSHSLAHQPR